MLNTIITERCRHAENQHAISHKNKICFCSFPNGFSHSPCFRYVSMWAESVCPSLNFRSKDRKSILLSVRVSGNTVGAGRYSTVCIDMNNCKKKESSLPVTLETGNSTKNKKTRNLFGVKRFDLQQYLYSRIRVSNLNFRTNVNPALFSTDRNLVN